MHYRPRFVLWTALVRQLPLQLFLTVWAGVFFGGMFAFGGVLAGAMRGGRPDLLAAFLSGPAAAGTVAFLGVPLVTVGAKWLNYRNTRYLLSDRFLDVEEGFLTVQAKRVGLSDLREVTLRRGILQRLSGVGSVYLATRATGGGGSWRASPMLGATSLTGSGVMLADLPDWQAAHAALRARLGAPPSPASRPPAPSGPPGRAPRNGR